MLNKQAARKFIKQAGIMDMLSGAAGAVSEYAPEGLGGLMGAGSAAGLAGMGGAGSGGQMIAAAIGATIGAMAANKMKEHEQMQGAAIDSNSMLGINNALMNLDQQQMLDPYGMGMGPGGGMMDGSGMAAMGMDPSMMGGMDPNMMGMTPPSQPVGGYPEAQQAMQGKQASVMTKQAAAELVKTASALVDSYFA